MRAAPGTRADYVHFHQHSTRWGDNDSYGHLNNAVHLMIIDSTVNAWLIGRGLLRPLHSAAIGLVVENGCRYHAELAYPQDLTAGLRVAHIGRSSVRYEVGLFGAADDRAAAEGFLVHVYVDAASRRPVPLPQTTRTALASLAMR